MHNSAASPTSARGDPASIIAALQRRADVFIVDSPFFGGWSVGNVSREVANRFVLAFDHLVASFPSLIAMAISRLGEAGRVVLSKNLFQECGEGDIQRTHHAIYRKFLRSAGVPYEDHPIDDHTRRWRSDLGALILSSEPSQVVGHIAAGEVLAQPALTRIYEALQPLYPDSDVEYFTTHLVLETNHVAEIVELIALECGSTDDFALMVRGFERGLDCWQDWFRSMTHACSSASLA